LGIKKIVNVGGGKCLFEGDFEYLKLGCQDKENTDLS
jgi:hypothetical protein